MKSIQKSESTDRNWKCALTLNKSRGVEKGSHEALCEAIQRGADLRVYTEWTFEEHIAPDLNNPDQEWNGLLKEIIDMRETILVEDRYVAGITTLRQPIMPCVGFNPNATNRTSFFMYGMDGQQACASISLDASSPNNSPGRVRRVPTPPNMPKMSETQENDLGTIAPSRNFIYEMESYRYFVKDDWSPLLFHDEKGKVTFGSWNEFEKAHDNGREFKVGITGLCADLEKNSVIRHEVFSHLGTGWMHTRHRRHEALTHPIVRVAPAIPMGYQSGNWDVSWVYLRTDGRMSIRSINPYTRQFRDWDTRLACRWFVR